MFEVRKYYQYGLGSIGYAEPPATPGGVPALFAANNGLSLSTIAVGTVVLGQNVGQAGDPGKLISNREIPMNNFSLAFTGMNNSGNIIWKDDITGLANYIKVLGQNSSGAEIFRIAYSGDTVGDNGSIFVGNTTGAAATGAGLHQSTLFGWKVAPVANPATNCTGFGYEVFLRLTTGINLDGFGYNALAHNTTGNNNGAYGQNGLFNVSTGNRNTSVGVNTGQGYHNAASDNFAGGYQAGVFLGMPGTVEIDQSVIIGSNAFATNTIGGGTGLIAIGYNIGNQPFSFGTNTILIGAGIALGAAVTNAMAFGAGITVSVSNVGILGRADQNIQVGYTVGPADTGDRLQVNGNISGTGAIRLGIRTITANDTFGFNDYGIIADTSGGNITVMITPATILDAVGYIKKKGTDANSVTLTATAGSIYAGTGPVASITWSGAGESHEFQSDGVNIYVK